MSASDNTGAAAQQVHDTAELQEMVLLEMDIKDIADNLQDTALLAQLKASSKLQKKLTEHLLTRDPVYILDRLHSNNGLRYLVKRSHELQHKLYLRQLPSTTPVDTPHGEGYKLAQWTPNRMLCPQPHDGVGTGHPYFLQHLRYTPAIPKCFSIGKDHYELSIVNEGTNIYAGGRDPGSTPDNSSYTLRFRNKTVFLQYTLNLNVTMQQPELPPEYLNTHLSNTADPVIVKIERKHEMNNITSCRVWVPPGTTLRQVLQFAKWWKMGLVKEGGVMRGMYIFRILRDNEIRAILRLDETDDKYLDKCERGALVRHEWRMVPRTIREELRKEDRERAAAT